MKNKFIGYCGGILIGISITLIFLIVGGLFGILLGAINVLIFGFLFDVVERKSEGEGQ